MVCTVFGGCSLDVRWNSPSENVNFHPAFGSFPSWALLNRRALPFPAGMTTLPVWLQALFSLRSKLIRDSPSSTPRTCVCASECLRCLSAMRSIKLS